jgi:hypothetical protein
MLVMPASNEHGKLSVEEQHAGCYTMMVNGARGLFFFTWRDDHAMSAKALTPLSEEIRALAPALTRRRPRQEVTTAGMKLSDTAVDVALLATPEDNIIVMAVNKTHEPVAVTCQFSWLEGQHQLVNVFGKEPAIEIADGRAEVSLEPLATRAWRIEGYKLLDMYTMHTLTLTETHK